ncbi:MULTISPECIES: pyridoxal-dependent decarboxylase, exosortase A system-associated [unclassified Amycolatopsis]|uniref:pyridoxal-dependent decarboxylase, exosortase A system-associated n=1 Tax=unclassified Amycolatopsis TaxID=2618356 RepID=UPI002874F2FA|nr:MULTISPECIES: pyridoxal-dependent decarboxylase, exosortase A system-associated [unclassified Amycolatopsis]MDS0134252.1 pyridoxal-dependent decarboxylase, exosortase A system-associated [Amycolatopsis sp. 505]MDS0146807.1 pyridoxal-dependent decarboxylase, exosortase A system-associated [Amycolatopsis sp. CM201R]
MANTTEAAAAPFGRAGGVLTVGGVPVDRLAARVGTTPFFAYDRSLVTTRVERVRAALPGDVELSYAVKANPMPALLHHLSGLVDGLDVASAGELRQALDTTVPPERISFAGPGKTPAELARAVAAGVTVELESTTELARVREAGDRLGLTPRVALRVNPDFAVRGSGMRLGGGPQQFGIDAERVPAVLAEVGAAGLDFQGFHVFAGSQNLRAESLCEAQRATVDLVLQLAEAAPGPVRSVNLGGGFGIPYTARDTALDLDEVGENLAKLLDVSLRPALPDARVVIELGRYLVGEAGVYLTRVVDRKVSRGTTFLVVDGGLHHQLAASGNFGQAIRRNYPLALASAPGGPEETVTVVGCLCTPLDLLGDKVSLPGAAIGDLIAIFQAGAYGLTASPTAFLGHPAPPEVLV